MKKIIFCLVTLFYLGNASATTGILSQEAAKEKCSYLSNQFLYNYYSLRQQGFSEQEILSSVEIKNKKTQAHVESFIKKEFAKDEEGARKELQKALESCIKENMEISI